MYRKVKPAYTEAEEHDQPLQRSESQDQQQQAPPSSSSSAPHSPIVDAFTNSSPAPHELEMSVVAAVDRADSQASQGGRSETVRRQSFAANTHPWLHNRYTLVGPQSDVAGAGGRVCGSSGFPQESRVHLCQSPAEVRQRKGTEADCMGLTRPSPSPSKQRQPRQRHQGQ